MKLVARHIALHNSCIHSMSARSWCQITTLTQSCIRTSGIPPPNTDVTTPNRAKLLQVGTPLRYVEKRFPSSLT